MRLFEKERRKTDKEENKEMTTKRVGSGIYARFEVTN